MATNSYLLWGVIVLAVLGLIVIILRLRRLSHAKQRMTRDNTGFFKYHRETEFQRKIAYEKKPKGKKGQSTDGGVDESLNKAVAVINFNGDLRAKYHRTFARLVDEVEVNKDELSEVVVVITSPGGMVAQYGHAYSQMERLRKLDLHLTVCIDVVAASGGYLMSLPANKIIAASFAMVGSVGVVAFVPNIRKLLLNWDVNPRTFTAGKYKRTVGLTDEATEEQVTHFQGQLEAVQRLFLDALRRYRPQCKIEEIETGDHWTAQESFEKELGLVDELGNSSEYLLKKNRTNDLLMIGERGRMLEGVMDWFSESMGEKLKSLLTGLVTRY